VPDADFCPLMDRNFVALQEKVKADPALNVHLLTVSFDPVTDTPPVLKKHAKTLGADPRVWSFLTGKPEEYSAFATRFGVSVMRGHERPARHPRTNLRTAIIGSHREPREGLHRQRMDARDVMADIKSCRRPIDRVPTRSPHRHAPLRTARYRPVRRRARCSHPWNAGSSDASARPSTSSDI
jgi:hypothetical protein